jgi:uncharacterized protein YkwD
MYLPQQDQHHPSAQEQEMLELINRMRMKPANELNLLVNSSDAQVNKALNFFNVNLAQLSQQWSQLTPVQPLAWSNELHNGALNHSLLMIQEDTQSHQLPGELKLGQRLTRLDTTGLTLVRTSMLTVHRSFRVTLALPLIGALPQRGYNSLLVTETIL